MPLHYLRPVFFAESKGRSSVVPIGAPLGYEARGVELMLRGISGFTEDKQVG